MKLNIGDSVKLKDGRNFEVVDLRNGYFYLKDNEGKIAKVKDEKTLLRDEMIIALHKYLESTMQANKNFHDFFDKMANEYGFFQNKDVKNAFEKIDEARAMITGELGALEDYIANSSEFEIETAGNLTKEYEAEVQVSHKDLDENGEGEIITDETFNYVSKGIAHKEHKKMAQDKFESLAKDPNTDNVVYYFDLFYPESRLMDKYTIEVKNGEVLLKENYYDDDGTPREEIVLKTYKRNE